MAGSPRIKKLKVLPDLRLTVTWRSGGTDTIDLAGMIDDFAPFRPLEDPALFAQARIVAYGGGIAWPNGVDFSADSLHELAEEQRREFTGESFKEWQSSMELSNSEAAELLDVDPSTIKNYRAKKTSLPRIVRFACDGLAAKPALKRAHVRPRKAGRPRKATSVTR